MSFGGIGSNISFNFFIDGLVLDVLLDYLDNNKIKKEKFNGIRLFFLIY